jgi:hypothetical protein
MNGTKGTAVHNRKCQNCGAMLEGGTLRCDYCGADWSPPASPPPSTDWLRLLILIVPIVIALLTVTIVLLTRSAAPPQVQPIAPYTPVVIDPNEFLAIARDASASSAAGAARIAQFVRYQDLNFPGFGGSPYADNLDDLLRFDSHLTHDPDVTFIFGAIGAQGFTFTTMHAKGKKTFVITEP